MYKLYRLYFTKCMNGYKNKWFHKILNYYYYCVLLRAGYTSQIRSIRETDTDLSHVHI